MDPLRGSATLTPFGNVIHFVAPLRSLRLEMQDVFRFLHSLGNVATLWPRCPHFVWKCKQAFVPYTRSAMQASFRSRHSFGNGSTSWLRYAHSVWECDPLRGSATLTPFGNVIHVMAPLPSLRLEMQAGFRFLHSFGNGSTSWLRYAHFVWKCKMSFVSYTRSVMDPLRGSATLTSFGNPSEHCTMAV
jgi:hypothetical protein